MSNLFKPITLGSVTAPNRILMAPPVLNSDYDLDRAQADPATFYTQGVEGYPDYPTLLDSKAAA